MSNLKRYNRFLVEDESIPLGTLYRRRMQASASSGNIEPTVEMPIHSSSRITTDSESSTSYEYDECPNIEDMSDVEAEGDEACSSFSSEMFEDETDDPVSIENNFDVKDPFSPLYTSADVTNLEAFLCILAFCIRFHLSGTCTDELLRLLKILLPACNIPGSKYLLNESVKSSLSYNSLYKIHLYCDICSCYLTEMGNNIKEIFCSVCNENKLSSDLIDSGNFFIYIPLEEQIRKKLEKEDLSAKITDYCKSRETGAYTDVISGENYSLPDTEDNISIQFNVDGIPMYHKAKYDLWPIHCMINELPPNVRKENIMMCGLWFGSKKPVFKTYLKPFINELNVLSERGLSWSKNGINFLTKIIPLLCTADAPARAMLQNFNQYNGEYGCGFCVNEGERIERGRGFSRIYKILNYVEERTFSKTIEYAEAAVQLERPVKGVKGPSLLMQLYPHFDMIQGFVPDYMHCVLLGVTRQLVTLWLSSSDKVYTLTKNKIAELNERISNIRGASEMTRKLRSFSEVTYWKASEWRIFLLISPVLLLNILNHNVYQHWVLLVHGISLLLGSKINSDDLRIAESALQKFVNGVQEVYGVGELTYNIHLLLHLPEKVRTWGPLWASSCFAYEDALGNLKNFHQGTKGVPMQILGAYLKKTVFQNLMLGKQMKNHRAEQFIEDMRRGKRATKKTLRINSITLLGANQNEKLSTNEKKAVEKFLNISVNESIIPSFKRALYKKILFTTKKYSQQFNRVDSFVSVLTSKINIVEIIKIIVWNNNVIFFGTKLKTKKFFKNDDQVGELCSNIRHVKCGHEETNKSIIAFRAESIQQKYIQLNFETAFYLVPLQTNAEE